MSQEGSDNQTKTYHYLIIDDSEIIRTQLSRSIASICTELGHSYQLYQANRTGQLFEQPQTITLPTAPDESAPCYKVYTAATFKLAVRALDLFSPQEMTVLCDVSIPADTEVGLLGLLETLVRRQLPVNLIFISSEYQNRAMIEPLLQKGKAYFIEKGSALWNSLPEALVRRADNFSYYKLLFSDYSTTNRPAPTPAFLDKMGQATNIQTQPAPTPAADGAETIPAPAIVDHPSPVRSRQARSVESNPAETSPKPRLVATLVNTVSEIPGRARALGTNSIRELPNLLKNLPRPGRRKDSDK